MQQYLIGNFYYKQTATSCRRACGTGSVFQVCQQACISLKINQRQKWLLKHKPHCTNRITKVKKKDKKKKKILKPGARESQ